MVQIVPTTLSNVPDTYSDVKQAPSVTVYMHIARVYNYTKSCISKEQSLQIIHSTSRCSALLYMNRSFVMNIV